MLASGKFQGIRKPTVTFNSVNDLIVLAEKELSGVHSEQYRSCSVLKAGPEIGAALDEELERMDCRLETRFPDWRQATWIASAAASAVGSGNPIGAGKDLAREEGDLVSTR